MRGSIERGPKCYAGDSTVDIQPQSPEGEPCRLCDLDATKGLTEQEIRY
jgi:hypothetical protein